MVQRDERTIPGFKYRRELSQSYIETAIRRVAGELRTHFGRLVEDEDAIDWRWMAERVLAATLDGQ